MSSRKLTEFMAENYCRASVLELPEWLSLNPPPCFCEEKFDGFRVFMFKSSDKILFATRHGRIYSEASHPALFKKILPFLSPELPSRIILDGEYISPDELHVFDVLRVEDEETSALPLFQRKEILVQILSKEASTFLVPYVTVNSFQEIVDFNSRVISNGGEGTVVKNPSSVYGQKNSWLKMKRSDTVDCFVIGYERTIEMDRTGIAHSWYIGLYNDAGQVVEMGKVGAYLKDIDPSMIKPGTVLEIRYHEVTEDMKFREPLIIRIREDKRKEECTTTQLPHSK